jgi:FkbM family methyltransferase
MASETAQAPGEKIASIVREGVEVRFVVVNPTTQWRVQTIMTKEPGTIAWIEEFAPDDVLVDIGANVGMYALCAAAFRGTRVYAFEPESQNFAILNRNIYLNRLDERVTAYCAALSDRTGFDLLYLSKLGAGSSQHTFGESVNHELQPMDAAFRQGSYATTLDALVEAAVIPVPSHIKIDVDGIEHKVISGAARTLANPGLRSVLVELNTNLDEHWSIVDLMLGHGFSYSEEEAARARREDGPFKGTGNYVFRR